MRLFSASLWRCLLLCALFSGFQAGASAAVLTILESSEPAGYVSRSASQNSGATYTSSTAPWTADAYSFSYWKLNGVRQADAAGRSLNPVSFVPTANATLVAVYTLTPADTDNDGLPDAFELDFFGDLSKTASVDADGEGLSNTLENLLGYHPSLYDSVSEGGLSARFSPITILPFSNSYYAVQTVSDPPGFLESATQYVTGSTMVSMPMAPDSVNGYRFAGWYLGTARADSPTTNQPANLSVIGATVFTAKYVLESSDSDADGIPDWYEWFAFSGLFQAANSDTDSDGLSLAMEQILGFAPYLTNTVSEGGLAMRFSPISDLNLAGYRSLRVTSDPLGLQEESVQLGEQGGTLQTPDLFASVVNGYRFVGWYVDGAQVKDATTAAAGSASVLMNADRVAIAKYVLETEDADADGIPDWQEMFYDGSLGATGATDADGDGLGLSLEFLLGYHPDLVDVVSEGGLSMRFSPVTNASFDSTLVTPVITRQPVSQVLKVGDLVSFSIEADTSVGLSYLWRKDGVNLAGGTSATFTIASALMTDAGSYSVVVGNSVGSVASSSASLVVSKATPVITVLPTAPAITFGQPLSSSVLSGGSASVAGKFAFSSPSTVPGVGTTSQSVTFTPSDLVNYSTATTSVSVLVNPLVSPPGITSGTSASGTVGAVFNYQISATNNPTSYSATGLPSGLTVNASTGLISGTPTTNGQTSVTLRATNSAGTGVATLTLNVTQPVVQGVPVITSFTTAAGISGGPFTYQITATNNPTSFSATGLPAGLSVNSSTGVISGSLNVLGQFPITLTATNSTGVGSGTLSLTVSSGTLNWSDLAGTYEGLLEQSPDSQADDGAAYRGAFSLTFSRTGSVSGRVFYNEATALDGSQSRVYVPVTRTFGGMLSANSANPLVYQKVVRLGTGTSLGRQELTLEVSFAETPPRLNVTVKDTASPSVGEDAWVSQALSCSRSLTKLPASTILGGGTLDYSKAVGRYTLSATDGDPSGANNAHVLAQLLSTGKLLWTSRTKGTFGTGSTGLRVAADGLNASVYEGRVSSTSTSLKSTSLLGSLNFVLDSTSGSWIGNFGSDTVPGKLEKQASYVSKTGGKLAFNDAQDSTGVTELDFSNKDGVRWGNTTVTTVPTFLSGGTSTSFPFTLNAQDPPDSDGNPAFYSWNISITSAGRVSTTSTADENGVASPRLLLTLNRLNGEFTGYYMSNISGKNVRRNIHGCGLLSQTDETLRARGWVESGVLPTLSTGGWTLQLGQ